jgi:hypothetical protein
LTFWSLGYIENTISEESAVVRCMTWVGGRC